MAASATPAFAAAQPAPAPTATATAQPVPEVQTNANTPQQVIPVTDAATAPKSDTAIFVTGSRIRRPNLESVVPVTTIQGEQFFQRGTPDIGEALNDLPQLRSTFAQSNPGLGIGIAGLNLLDLRGLSPKRTLVLVNGRRHVPADILSSASVPDVNTIPADLIDRVDIVTGGNSAVYGSDAVAGVVNFILKRDFDGVQVRAQGAEAAAGFGTTYYGSVLLGKNFDGGRGNITLHGEYNHENRIFGDEVPWLRHNDNFSIVDVDVGGLAHGSDAFPDRTFVNDIRSSTINRFGLVPITYPAANPLCGTGLAATNGAPGTTGGIPYNCTYVFNPAAALTPQTGTRIGAGPNAAVLGGNGQTGREDQLLAVFPRNNRYNFNLLAHYSISEAFEPFVEAKFVRLDTSGNNAGPSFIQGTFGTGDIRERTRLDNPFLDPTARTIITNALLASGCNPSLQATCQAARSTLSGQGIGGPLNAADIAAINAGTYRFITARTLLDAGIRDEAFRRDTYRAVIGARGTFNTDWSYEVSANYGRFDQKTHTTGFLDRQRFMLSMDAGRNPTTGAIQCRSQFDPASATVFTRLMNAAQIAFNTARLAADVAACVPYNPFGQANNAAAVQYFTTDEHKSAKMTQLDFLGFVNGDSSQLFELPGGPIGFVLGAEYRRETARYTEDPFVEIGQPNFTPGTNSITNDVDVGNFVPPAFHVAEAFAELNVPLLKDMPFIHELSLSGAGRFSRYGRAVGDVWTYNFGGEFAPIRDLRFRGNFGKSVRAPNLSETAFPQVPNFAPGFQDPCSTVGLAQGSGSRSTNCQTDLGALLPTVTQGTYSLAVVNGSNPLLQPEVSYSLTLGGVLQPRMLPGFSLSVDYYNIRVKNVIVALGGQQIANLCYDQPSLNNVYCGLFTRWRGPGAGPNNEQPGDIRANSLVQAGVNFAKRIRRGVDINANYRARLASNVVLDTGLIWVHSLKSSNYNNPALPNFEDRLLEELGDPKDEGRLDADLKVGNVTFGYQMHYIGPMYLNLFEDFGTLPAGCTDPVNPATGCPPNNADYADIHKYPAIAYHGLRIQWDTGPAFSRLKNIQIYAGVNNVLDRRPPFGLTATGAGSAIYDVFGRKFYGGIKARF
jgi:outer membrane receptor protein involved in Fe transport